MPSLSSLAEQFLPQILAASDGRPLLTIPEAAAALASLGAPGGTTPTALRKVIARQALPPAAISPRQPGCAIRLHATALAAWLAGDLRPEPAHRRPAVPVSASTPSVRRTGAPGVVLVPLAAAEADDFVLPRGYRHFVVLDPGQSPIGGSTVLVQRARPAPVPVEVDPAVRAVLAALSSELDELDRIVRATADRPLLRQAAGLAPDFVPPERSSIL